MKDRALALKAARRSGMTRPHYILRIVTTCTAILTLVTNGSAQAPNTGFLDRNVTVEGVEYRYQVFVPRAYSDSLSWPVILALHGSGERGRDGMLQTQVGLATAIRSHADRYQAIVVFPQSPIGAPGWHGQSGRVALAALDSTITEFKTDPARIYLTGYSMGGNGAWYLAYHNPNRFAAVVVVCGFISELRPPSGIEYPAIVSAATGDPFREVANRIHHIPVWILHGDADPVIPVEESRRMAAALREAHAQVHYTELPGVGHNAWDPAYNREELSSWLLAQRRR